MGGPLSGAIRGSPLQTPGDVMKTPIKVMKRDDRKAGPAKEVSSLRTKTTRATEVIVKSWVMEFRERRAALNPLHKAERG